MINQEEPDNTRRIFTKNKSQKELTMDQKTSTNDNDNILPKKSILKKQNTTSDLSFGIPYNLQSNVSKKKFNSILKLSRKKSKKKVKIIKYDLLELKNKINEINININKEKNISINDYNNLNLEINDKNDKIKNLASEQKELISKLKLIKNELNNKLERLNDLILRKKEASKKEKELRKLITVKEKEIVIANKKSINEKNEYKRIIKFFNDNDHIKENNLRKELFELNNNISKLESDIRKLSTTLEQHEYCEKHKNELLHYLSLLNNAYQFEIKKMNMINMEINSESEKELNNSNLKSLNSNSNNTLEILCSPKIKRTKKILLNNKSQPNLIIKNTYTYINNILNNINNEYSKETGYIKNSNNLNFKMKKKCLFNSKENFFLEKIIPNNYLIKCKERFDNIENENNKIKEKINQIKIKNERIISEKQIKIEIKEIKLKTTKREEVKLNIDINKQKKLIDELKKKINEINKETKKYNNIIDIKDKENTNLKNKMNEFKKNRKKVKKKVEKDEQIDNNNNGDKKLIIVNQSEDFKEENQKSNINYFPI